MNGIRQARDQSCKAVMKMRTRDELYRHYEAIVKPTAISMGMSNGGVRGTVNAICRACEWGHVHAVEGGGGVYYRIYTFRPFETIPKSEWDGIPLLGAKRIAVLEKAFPCENADIKDFMVSEGELKARLMAALRAE